MATMRPELIEAVWLHGRVMPEADPEHWRQDACGAWMRREQFGREDTDFGWKIESVVPGGAQTADRSSVPAEKYATPPRNRSL
jgi:hypothetical protein